MNKIILEILIKITITGSIFFVETLFLSKLTSKIFSAKWHFILSKICMILFVLPISFITSDKVFLKSDLALRYSSAIINAYTSLKLENYEYLYILIWLIGLIIFCSINLLNYIKFNKALVYFDSCDYKLNDIIKKHNPNLSDKVKIIRNSNIKSPMLMGIVNPIIRIPKYLNNYDELNLIISHELIHYKRKDLLFKMLNIFIISINWFNPLVYLANRNMNRWCEISCDELLVRSKMICDRKLYGKLLLKVIESVDTKNDSNKLLSVYLCNESKYIKNRLYMVLYMKKNNIIKKCISSIILCAVVFEVIAVSTISTARASNEMKSLIEKNLQYIDGYSEHTNDFNGVKYGIDDNYYVNSYYGKVEN